VVNPEISPTSFIDTKDRKWNIEITIYIARKFKSELDFDILDNSQGSTFVERLANDVMLICDAVYLACKDKADERGITDEDFGRAMGGDVLGNALAALMQAIINFTPRQKNREALRKMWKTSEKVQAVAFQKMGDHYEKVDVDKVVNKICGEQFMKFQEFLE
jgi:hypothetical protein